MKRTLRPISVVLFLAAALTVAWIYYDQGVHGLKSTLMLYPVIFAAAGVVSLRFRGGDSTDV